MIKLFLRWMLPSLIFIFYIFLRTYYLNNGMSVYSGTTGLYLKIILIVLVVYGFFDSISLLWKDIVRIYEPDYKRDIDKSSSEYYCDCDQIASPSVGLASLIMYCFLYTFLLAVFGWIIFIFKTFKHLVKNNKKDSLAKVN